MPYRLLEVLARAGLAIEEIRFDLEDRRPAPHAKRYVDGLRLWQPTATKTAGQAS